MINNDVLSLQPLMLLRSAPSAEVPPFAGWFLPQRSSFNEVLFLTSGFWKQPHYAFSFRFGTLSSVQTLFLWDLKGFNDLDQNDGIKRK